MRLITAALSLAARGLDRGRLRRADGRGAVDPADRDGGRAATRPATWPSTCGRPARSGPSASGWPGGRPRCRASPRPRSGECWKRSGPGSSCCRWWSATRRPSRRARCSTTATRSSSPRGSPPVTRRWGRPSGPLPRRAARRVPGHQPRAARLLRALFGGGHPVTAVGDPCQSIYGWRGASAGNLRRFAHDFPARAGARSPVRLLSTSFRNTGRVLDAAATLQAELRAEAPDVPLLVPAPGRSDRGRVTAALLPTAVDEADWVADQAAALLALPIGSAPDGRAWPGGSAPSPRMGSRRRPPVRHRGPVQETVPVRGAAPGAGGAVHPVRGGRARRPALGPGGTGRGGHAARAPRRGRVGRAGPAADRTALADRPA